jgi:hypothetical protein
MGRATARGAVRVPMALRFEDHIDQFLVFQQRVGFDHPIAHTSKSTTPSSNFRCGSALRWVLMSHCPDTSKQDQE